MNYVDSIRFAWDAFWICLLATALGLLTGDNRVVWDCARLALGCMFAAVVFWIVLFIELTIENVRKNKKDK